MFLGGCFCARIHYCIANAMPYTPLRMSSALPTPNSCCTCGSAVNTTALDSYIKVSVDANIGEGQTFADAAALRAFTGYVDGVQYWISTATGGTGAGQWVYDATDAQVDDGSTVIKPNNILTANPGRYTRLNYILLGG